MQCLIPNIVQFFSAGSVIILCLFICMSVHLQQRVFNKAASNLKKFSNVFKNTKAYTIANDYIDVRVDKDGGRNTTFFVNAAFQIPIILLLVIVFFFSSVSYFGAVLYKEDVRTPSYVLGGSDAVASTSYSNAYIGNNGVTNDENDARYVEEKQKLAISLKRTQAESIFVITIAFFVSYLWVIKRLIIRINNYDVSPVTFYFLSVRILAACLAAGFAPHIVKALSFGSKPDEITAYTAYLALLGFVIGVNPYLWLDWAGQLIYERLRIVGRKRQQAAPEDMPQEMSLAMIQGLTDDKIARLNELDIDNCLKLARENALIIWVRTPYNLEIILDWISQAQLCILWAPAKIQSLRKNGIRDIFAYKDALGDKHKGNSEEEKSAFNEVQQIVGAPEGILALHASLLDDDPAFEELRELRAALLKDKKSAPQETANN